MTNDGNTRDEVVRLTQELVTEGARVTSAFTGTQGMHPTDVAALTCVLTAEQRGAQMMAGELARQLGLTTGAITGAVDRLERTGYLRRVHDPRDRRKVLLECTPEGRALTDHYLGPVRRRSDAVMDQFTPDELETVRRFLAATGQAMTAHRHSMTTQAPHPPAARRAEHSSST